MKLFTFAMAVLVCLPTSTLAQDTTTAHYTGEIPGYHVVVNEGIPPQAAFSVTLTPVGSPGTFDHQIVGSKDTAETIGWSFVVIGKHLRVSAGEADRLLNKAIRLDPHWREPNPPPRVAA